jgi:hypothetical protein
MTNDRIFKMAFASVYPMYVKKLERKRIGSRKTK